MSSYSPSDDIHQDIGSIFNMLGYGPLEGATEHQRMIEDQKRLARRDFREYMKLMNPGYIGGRHIDEMIETFEAVERGELDRVILSVPPRHSKSMHTSEGFPAWYMGRNPNNMVIAASHTQRLAEKFSRSVRNQIASTYWPFPWVGIAPDNGGVGQWSIDQYDGAYLAVGVGGSPTGQGGHLIIIDDPIRTQEDAESPLMREKTWEWYQGTLYTRRQPGAAIIITATRWHEDDLIGRVIEHEKSGGDKWHVLNIPAESPDGTFLWPEFWSDEEYIRAKRSSTRVWNSQYMGRPSTEGGNLIHETWFRQFQYPSDYSDIVVAYDTAEKVGLTNDFTACAVFGKKPSGYDLLHIHQIRVEFPDLIRDIDTRMSWALTSFGGAPVTLVIEDASSGTAALQYMRSERDYITIGAKPYRANEKEMRVLDVTPLVENGRVYVPEIAPWKRGFFSQITQFPYDKNDDMVDAFTIGLRHIAGIGESSGSSISMTRYNDDDEVGGLDFERRRRRISEDY